jgi:hypothetical protein
MSLPGNDQLVSSLSYVYKPDSSYYVIKRRMILDISLSDFANTKSPLDSRAYFEAISSVEQ